MEYLLLTIIAGAIFFPGLFRLSNYILDATSYDAVQKLTQSAKLDISVKVVSAIQGILAVIVGGLTMINTSSDLLWARYPLLEQYIIFAITYMYYDAWAMYQVYIHDKKNVKDHQTFLKSFKEFVCSNKLMMTHHLLLPVFYGPILVYLRNGKSDYLVGCSFMMETTIPFISLRNILLHFGKKKSTLYIINGVCLVISFALARIFIWFFMLWEYAKYRSVTFIEAFFLLPLLCVFGTFIFVLMNLYWFVKILKVFIKSVRELFFSSNCDLKAY